jgi:DNA-binding MarR family transcriptional regulator
MSYCDINKEKYAEIAKHSMTTEENTGPALDDGIYEGLAGVRLAMRRFLSFSELALAKTGITSQQYQALLVIRASAGHRVMVRELANLMLLSHNGAVQLVDRLVLAGFVDRIPSTEDKRSVLIGLTPDGSTMLEDLARIHLKGMLANESLLIESLTALRSLAHLE